MHHDPETPVWVSCPDVVWRAAWVVKSEAGQVTVELVNDQGARSGEIVNATTSGRDILRRDAALFDDGALEFDDLTEVRELHGAEVLHALDVRFAHGAIYTLTGPVLLALNPFRMLPRLYSPDVLRQFLVSEDQRRGNERARPHVFGVSAKALRGIQKHGNSQTVLISGESGAGKTETTKFVMQFLALAGAEHLAGTQAQANNMGRSPSSASTTPMGRSPSQLTFGMGRDRLPSTASAGGGTGRSPDGFAEESMAESTTQIRTGTGMSRVERQVLGSNPLLEAFGNAKTLRNDNSSRFGKYIELQFGLERPGLSVPPRLVGARVRTYLLEKVRVIRQQPGERSFHIFYQALAAARSPERLAAVGVPPAAGKTFNSLRPDDADRHLEIDLQAFTGFQESSFDYLKGGLEGAPPGDPLLDREEFKTTLSAMRAVGMGPAIASDLFRTLGAILHLGNIEFRAPDTETSEVVEASGRYAGLKHRASEEPFSLVCDLLGVPSKELARAFCTQTLQAASEAAVRKGNTVQKAMDCRDALARHLYHAVFSHVVQHANQSVGFLDEAVFCGVLDIFGFEFFETNSFEQLCINFTNELLQQYFNTFIFKTEAALYQEECIDWRALDFPDNGVVVQLLQDKTVGVLSMLDEECFTLSGTSESWVSKIVKKHEGHSNFGFNKLKPGCFLLRHFAGPVTYTCDGFLEKNKDTLSRDLMAVLKESSRPFIRGACENNRAFQASAAPASSPDGLQGSPRSSPSNARVLRVQRYTVASEFRQQLHDLLGQVRTTEPHFIRCIKPNSKNKPFAQGVKGPPKPLFDHKRVAEQLSYQGVLEAIRVARAGYPIRLKHIDFLKEFGCIAGPRFDMACGEDRTVKDVVHAFVKLEEVQALLDGRDTIASLKENTSPKEGSVWAIGTSRVFLKQEPYSALRTVRMRIRNSAATILQRRWRVKLAVDLFERVRDAIRTIQGAARARAARSELLRRKRERASTHIEACLRMALLRRLFLLRRRVALSTQSWARGLRCRKAYQAQRENAMRLQRWWRSLRKRRRFRQLQSNILKIQAMWRVALARRAATDLKARLHRAKLAMRALLRIRRRNAAHRTWRLEMLAKYRASPKPAPSREELQQQLAETLKAFETRQGALQRARVEEEEWKNRLDELSSRAFVRIRRFFIRA